MGLLDQASNHTDQADLIILSHVETIRDQKQPATASAVASLIGGAPPADVYKRMFRMHQLGLLEDESRYQGLFSARWQLTEMGAELLRRDLIGWSPSLREQERRDLQLIQALDSARTLLN